MACIAILGAGVMGSALSYPLTDNGHTVRLIGTHLDGPIIARCKHDGVHPRLNRQLPPSVHLFTYEELPEGLAQADVIALGVNSRGIEWASATLAPYVRAGQPIIVVTKGLWATEQGHLRIFPDVLADGLPPDVRATTPIAAIGGPSIAGELAARRHTCVVFTCRDQAALEYLAGLFATEYYHIWTSTDMIGVEVCVALKNIYALGIGLVPGLLEAAGGPDGAAAMHNYAAALFAQGLVETAELVTHLGGRLETVFSLPGAGDLYVTTQGGRNSRMGRLLGMGTDPEEAIEQLAGETVEGLDAVAQIAPAVEQLIARGVFAADAFPLLRHIYGVAVQGMPVAPIFDRFFRQPSLALRPILPMARLP